MLQPWMVDAEAEGVKQSLQHYNARPCVRYNLFIILIEEKLMWKGFFYLISSNLSKSRLGNQLDQWAYGTLSLGFSFSNIGILSGAVWANDAGWDPKETWVLVTYGYILHG